MADHLFRHTEALTEGRSLSKSSVNDRERSLNSESASLNRRLELIGFYYANHEWADLTRHLDWVVRSFPHLRVWRRPELSLNYWCTPTVFAGFRELWLQAAEENPSNGYVYGNAGNFLISRDLALGTSLLKQALSLVPEDSHWVDQIYQWHYHAAVNGIKYYRPVHCVETVSAAETLLKYPEIYQSYALTADALVACATCFFWLDDFNKASVYAKEHLKLIKNQKGSKASRSVLGLLAIRQNKIDAAIAFLLDLDKVYEVTTLDLELANKLIALGQYDSVEKYLDLCETHGFWRYKPLRHWKMQCSKRVSFTLV
ncbi:MAG TPA: hypothetical protein V6C97_04235 [Oculatellaceae cyanobacterium]